MASLGSVKNTLIAGFALFAMFFGAGNLIFPPTLGQESGELWPLSLMGFLAMDAVLACVGIYAVNATGDPVKSLARAVGPKGGVILNTAAILCLCVLFAMPRTAATTFEISLAPYLGEGAEGFMLPFSLAFFAVVFLLAVRESRIVDIIGRFFTPTLVIGVLLLVVAGIVHPLGPIGEPSVPHVFQEGIRSGYQTMDVLGVVAFSIILLDSAILKQAPDGRDRRSMLVRASIVATVMLGVIYGGLAYLGATSASLGASMTQVQLVVAMTRQLLGDFGMAVLAVVVALACVTTAVALLSSAAAYFHGLLGGRASYRALLAADCVIGLLICNLGLQNIISLADPVLGVVYPPFLTVVCMLLFQRVIPARSVYQGAAIGAALAGLILELPLPQAAALAAIVPLGDLGFGWVPFAILGGFIGWLLFKGRRPKEPATP